MEKYFSNDCERLAAREFVGHLIRLLEKIKAQINFFRARLLGYKERDDLRKKFSAEKIVEINLWERKAPEMLMNILGTLELLRSFESRQNFRVWIPGMRILIDTSFDYLNKIEAVLKS